MRKGFFITILLFMVVWGGVAFGADTCPNVTGLWEANVNGAAYNPPDSPVFINATADMAIYTQNGCSFYGSFEDEFIIIVGTLRKLSLTQYAVTMQFVFDQAAPYIGSFVIEGTLNCTTSSDRRLEIPPGCNTMSTSFHGYFPNPNLPSSYINEVGTISFSKQ
jgi:hypothetical protein